MSRPRLPFPIVFVALVLMIAGCAGVPHRADSWDAVWRAGAGGAGNLGGTEGHPAEVGALIAQAEAADSPPGPWLALADVCARVGDTDRALVCLDEARSRLERLAAGDRSETVVEIVLARSLTHRDRGEGSLAKAWADTASRLAPDDFETLVVQGLARASNGDASGAINISRRLEAADALRFEWRWIRGMASLARGEREDAYHWLHEARPTRVHAARFWRDLALVAERLGDGYGAARASANAHAALRFPAGTTGQMTVSVPDPTGGAPLRLPLWQAYDGWPAAGSRLGWALTAADSALAASSEPRRRHWSDRASGLLSTCIRMDLEADRCRQLRGLVYLRAGAEELAHRDFRRLLEGGRNPDELDLRVLAGEGRLLLRRKRWSEALPLLRAATARAPERADVWGDLGLALMMMKRTESGERALGRAMALDPNLAAPWYNRGLARFQAGRWAAAEADLEQALELAPENEVVADLLRQAAQRARAARR